MDGNACVEVNISCGSSQAFGTEWNIVSADMGWFLRNVGKACPDISGLPNGQQRRFTLGVAFEM